ncbi:hypothetical protein [Salinisphaera sp. Q1T1-3]|uniref:hypothetical protein n=1 Tax=Salinisphaera sp. Q1T1-3 TaxID=2321229 RepID=UPI000E726785|nr:hypothetical protein [Salinisphaera sp. Q1T1-3]RJS95279.1 hypothetical protein D3260_01635 [Salinisphaera sp. Q1T1-3]
MAGAMSDGALADAPALVPPGRYQAIYRFHETAYFRSTPKVYLHLQISGGAHDGVRLYRAYRVARLTGKPKRYGGFKVHHSHAVFRQMVTLSSAVTRPDRISFSALKGCLLSVSVRTVTKDAGTSSRKPQTLPEALQYSVIDELLSIDAGSMEEVS